MMGKTVIFEEKYGVDVREFSTTEEIDKVVEEKIDRKMKIVKLEDHGVVHSRGNVFKMEEYDIEKKFEATIKPFKR